LTSRSRFFHRAFVGLAAIFLAPLLPASTNAPPANAIANKPATPAPQPPPPEDPFARYGRILAPGDEPAHPFKLTMPFPDVGEVKVPSQDELKMREKLENLAILSEDDIRTQLAQWPAFAKMSLKDEGLMLQRIQDFREHRTKIALAEAHSLGLVTLTPDQQARFEKEYWDKRLQMDRDLAKQFAPILQARQQKNREELFREFSSPTTTPNLAQTPLSAPAPAKPPQAATPVAQTKPAAPTPAPSVTPPPQQPPNAGMR
jgi:hypothetical protein